MIVELVILVLIFCLLREIIARGHGLPPGDGGFPLIGTMPRNEDELHKIIVEQKKKHGSMLCLKIRRRVVIVLTEFKLIKSIFLKLENFGKFQTFSLQSLDLSSIIVGVRGTEQNGIYRQRVLHIENVIRSEVKTLIEEFSKEVGTSINIKMRFNIVLLKVIWTLNNDRGFKLHDGDVHEFLENITKAGKIIECNQAQLDLVPWLKKLLPEVYQLKIMPFGNLESALQLAHSYIGKTIGSDEKTLECNSVDEGSLINPELLDMPMLLYKLILKNSENTSATILWFLLYMCFFPEVQENIHKEIDSCIPRGRLPLLSDQQKLPFLNATIHEVNRCCSSQPTELACLAEEETMFSGFKIPKGSLIYPHVESCHRDAKYFEKPDEFRPSRFLSEDGTLNNKKEGYLPFYQDRRLSRSESLSDMELFLFTSSIMQRFKVSPKEIGKLSLLDKMNSARSNNIIFYRRT